MRPFEFWQAVYIAAVRAGKSGEAAATAADDALTAQATRFAPPGIRK